MLSLFYSVSEYYDPANLSNLSNTRGTASVRIGRSELWRLFVCQTKSTVGTKIENRTKRALQNVALILDIRLKIRVVHGDGNRESGKFPNYLAENLFRASTVFQCRFNNKDSKRNKSYF